MGAPYTGDPTGNVVASYANPADGTDRVNAASVNVAIRGLTDDVARLNGQLERQGVASGESYVRAVSSYATDGTDIYTQADYPIELSPSPVALRWPLSLPDGAEVSEVFVLVDPDVGIGDLPSDPQTQRIQGRIRRVSRAGATTISGPFRDAVAGATYVDEHEATFGEFGLVIDNSQFAYELELEGETGGSSFPVQVLAPPFISYTVQAIT